MFRVVSEAAKLTGLSVQTIHNYIKRRILKAYRNPINRRYYIDSDSLEKLLKKMRGPDATNKDS